MALLHGTQLLIANPMFSLIHSFRRRLHAKACAHSIDYRVRAQKRILLEQRIIDLREKALPTPVRLRNDEEYRAQALHGLETSALLLRRSLMDLKFFFGRKAHAKALAFLDERQLVLTALVAYLAALLEKSRSPAFSEKTVAMRLDAYIQAYRKASTLYQGILNEMRHTNRWAE